MQSLLEVIFGIVFFAVIISCLPTIIGFISLCFIIYIIYLVINGLFTDGSEHTTANYDRQNEGTERQTMHTEQENERKSESNPKSYSTFSSPHYRHINYDDYDDYYDDRYDEVPPEEGDGFRGTGASFL